MNAPAALCAESLAATRHPRWVRLLHAPGTAMSVVDNMCASSGSLHGIDAVHRTLSSSRLMSRRILAKNSMVKDPTRLDDENGTTGREVWFVGAAIGAQAAGTTHAPSTGNGRRRSSRSTPMPAPNSTDCGVGTSQLALQGLLEKHTTAGQCNVPYDTILCPWAAVGQHDNKAFTTMD